MPDSISEGTTYCPKCNGYLTLYSTEERDNRVLKYYQCTVCGNYYVSQSFNYGYYSSNDRQKREH